MQRSVHKQMSARHVESQCHYFYFMIRNHGDDRHLSRSAEKELNKTWYLVWGFDSKPWISLSWGKVIRWLMRIREDLTDSEEENNRIRYYEFRQARGIEDLAIDSQLGEIGFNV